jgi:hypothetical protein
MAGVRPVLIETAEEKLIALQRRLFGEVFGCPIVDCYVSRELGTMAHKCE